MDGAGAVWQVRQSLCCSAAEVGRRQCGARPGGEAGEMTGRTNRAFPITLHPQCIRSTIRAGRAFVR